MITEALARYADEVRSGAFPEEQHTYAMPEEELKAFEASVARNDPPPRPTCAGAARHRLPASARAGAAGSFAERTESGARARAQKRACSRRAGEAG